MKKMSEHPIEGLMLTAMNSIREMVDVNTIIGEPIETLNNITIIPISKVGFGFAAGGSEFKPEAVNEYNRRDKNSEEIQYKLPFGGGSGARSKYFANSIFNSATRQCKTCSSST